MSEVTVDVAGRATTATRIEYRRGPQGVISVEWPDLGLAGAHEITFLARGERGGEMIEFKSKAAVGADGTAGLQSSLGRVTLSAAWRTHRLELPDPLPAGSILACFASPPEAGVGAFYLGEIQVR